MSKYNKKNRYSMPKKKTEPIWVYGYHAVSACFEQQAENIVEVLIANDDDGYKPLIDDMRNIGLEVKTVDSQMISKMLDHGARHQSIAIRLKKNLTHTEADLFSIVEKKQLCGKAVMLLVLDGVTDPRNLGACLRSANGAGVDAVIVPKDNASGITSVTRKTASGAAETTPFVQVTNLARTLRDLKTRNIWVVGTSDKATETIYEQDLNRDLALVVGAEDVGIRALTAKTCDQLVSLPMRGSVNSLNVSVASAVCLYEVLRQML